MQKSERVVNKSLLRRARRDCRAFLGFRPAQAGPRASDVAVELQRRGFAAAKLPPPENCYGKPDCHVSRTLGAAQIWNLSSISAKTTRVIAMAQCTGTVPLY